MSLYTSRRCLDIVGRAAGGSSSLSRTWSSTLVVQHRRYTAPAAAQKTKEKPAVHATAPPSTSRKAGKAVSSFSAVQQDAAEERTVEDEIEMLDRMKQLSETNAVDLTSAPLELMGELYAVF